jgi:hypothetical protein
MESYPINVSSVLVEADSSCGPVGMGNDAMYFYLHFVRRVWVSQSTRLLHHAFHDGVGDE